MGEEIKIFLPKLGESILEATIVQWLKKEGDEVEVDEPLLEVATDKLNSEIPSPVKGRIKKIYAIVDEELKVGDLLAIIETCDVDKDKKTKLDKENELEEKSKEDKREFLPKVKKNFSKFFLSPVAKILIEKNKISEEQLKEILPTGSGGRISRSDIEKYLDNLASSKSEKSQAVKLSPMRKAIAKSMIKSFQAIPSASLISEIDVTGVLNLIKEVKEEFLKKYGYKLTITAFLAKGIASSLKAYPYLNASLDDDTIYLKKEINLGLAINIDKGLIVPVISSCEKKSITEIAKSISLLGEKARKNLLSPEDIESGTITMSNFGMGGALIGIPIIKHPEAAIIGIGAIVKRVVVLQDDSLAVRSLMNVSLTFDHRIIDGMYGSDFMRCFKDYMENQAVNDFS